MHLAYDHNRHQMLRGALNRFWSKQKITAFTPFIQTQVEKLCARIEEFAESGAVLPIGNAFSAFTMDVVTEYVLESSYGNLDHPDFNRAVCDVVKAVGPVWRVGKHITFVPKLFEMTPLWAVKRLAPDVLAWKAFLDVSSSS